MAAHNIIVFDPSYRLPLNHWQTYDLDPENSWFSVYTICADGYLWDEAGNRVQFQGEMEIWGCNDDWHADFIATFDNGRMVSLTMIQPKAEEP